MKIMENKKDKTPVKEISPKWIKQNVLKEKLMFYFQREKSWKYEELNPSIREPKHKVLWKAARGTVTPNPWVVMYGPYNNSLWVTYSKLKKTTDYIHRRKLHKNTINVFMKTSG